VQAALRLIDSRRAIYAIVTFGLLLRVAALARIGGVTSLGIVGGKEIYYENPAYDEMALQLLHHQTFQPYWPPGVPYYLLFWHRIFGEGMLAARASILLVYVGFSFALYALTKEISNRRAGNIAVLVFALYPSYIRFAFDPSTEFPAAACLIAIAFLTMIATRRQDSRICCVPRSG